MTLATFLFTVAPALFSAGSGVNAAALSNRASSTVASSYFAGFHGERGFAVSSIPWSKYTDVKFAFAETNPDGSFNFTKSPEYQIPQFVNAAHANSVKALVSIGGWTGSRYFSTGFGSAENRTAFVKRCLDLVAQYNLDGLDFDWEYPNRQSLGCNAINANDTDNFLSFLQELRAQPAGKNLLLTAAGSLNPWYNASGVSSTNLAAFADVLDYVMIMNYDIYGAWATTAGPNAPLEQSCDARNNQGGGKEGVAKWMAAGLPASKLVLGVAAYGHGFSVNKTSAFISGTADLNMYPPQNSSHRFQGSSWDTDPAVDECGNASPPSGMYQFWSLVQEAGFLDESGNPRVGISTGYDTCSQTPAMYNATSEIWVSYDNTQSLTAKGQYISQTGLAGFGLWETGGDYNNILINAMRASLGLQ